MRRQYIAPPPTDVGLGLYGKGKYHRYDTGSVSVAAGGTSDIITIPGPGFLTALYHYNKGVGAEYAFVDIYLDGSDSLILGVPINLGQIALWGIGTSGAINIGGSAVIIAKWDTTNNIFEARNILCQTFFREKAYLRFRNTNTATAATMRAVIEYYTL